MRHFYKIIISAFIFSTSTISISQDIESECDCDILITNKNQSIPRKGNSGKETKNKTICFSGQFTYDIQNRALGDNVSLCVGDNVKLNINNVNFKGDKTLNNHGEIELFDNSLEKKNNITTMYSRNGTLRFSGNYRQYIDFNGTTEIESLIINNPYDVELSSATINIFDNISLINGDLITNHTGDQSEENLITFKSNSDETAILNEVKGSSQIIGAVRTERFLSASNRAYRYLSSSVNSKGSINDNWQEGVNNTVNNYSSNQNPNPGFGTHISGSKQGNNGFDATLTGNSSLFSWNVNTNNWDAFQNTNDSKLNAGEAFSILIRGDRNTNIYSSNSAYSGSTILRSTGNLITGDVDVSDQLNKNPGGFTLIGNPYQAQVDLKKTLQKSSSHLKKSFYYAWSPKLQSKGGYITVDLDSDPVEYIPSEKHTNSASASSSLKYIQPNQSVFIETASSASPQDAPSLVFKEAYKTNSTVANEVFSIPEEVSKLDLTLIRKKDNQVVDGVRFKFHENYSSDNNSDDATKVWNNEESFSILSNNSSYLAIEKRNYPEVDEKLKFWIGNYTSQNYQMIIELNAINEHDVFLIDNYTEEVVKLDNDTNTIDFDVDSSVQESVSSGRFEVIFEPVTLQVADLEENSIDFKLYPNPVKSGSVSLKFNSYNGDTAGVELYSMVGKKIEVPTNQISNTEVKINTSNLSTGIYLVKLTNGSKTSTRKLIVNN